MDSSGDGAILDFDLGELGALATTAAVQADELPTPSQAESEADAAIAAFDLRVASSGKPAVICMFRIGFGPLASETVKTVVRTRTLQKLERAAREGDICLRWDNNDILLGMSGCNVEGARNSIALMMKLFSVEMVHGPQDDMKMSAGIAPYAGDVRATQRTAQLACDLASFQENGYIEVVEF